MQRILSQQGPRQAPRTAPSPAQKQPSACSADNGSTGTHRYRYRHRHTDTQTHKRGVMVVQGWTQQSTTDTRCLMYRHACCKHVQPLGQGCAYLCLVDVVLVDRRVEAGEAIANVLLKEVAARACPLHKLDECWAGHLQCMANQLLSDGVPWSPAARVCVKRVLWKPRRQPPVCACYGVS